MSSTIKQAIEALKSRITDAYTAVSAKGGTLPATLDSAGLPAAIASIPSGGDNFGDGLAYDSTARAIKLFGGNNAGISELVDVNGDIISWAAGTIFKVNNLNKIKLPAVTSIPAGAFTNCSFLEELDLSSCVSISCNSANPAFTYAKVEEINMPAYVNNAVTGYLFANATTKKGYFPSMVHTPENFFNGATSLEYIYMPKVNTVYWGGTFNNCPKLIDIETGAYFNSSQSLKAWSPTEALLTNSTSLVKEGETFSSNREKLLYNIREHIAANLPDRTGLSSLTLTMSAAVKAAILADQPTADAFTNKNWIIA